MNLSDITVVCGPMFAGKSSYLIDTWEQMPRFRKETTLVFKHYTDTRYADYAIASHDGRQLLAIPVQTWEEIRDLIYAKDPKIVMIDEVQFFEEGLVDFIQEITSEWNIQFILAGLDMDCKGHPFGVMPSLLSIADSVVKLTNVCDVCKQPGTRTISINGNTGVGGSESYAARCVIHSKG